LASTPTTRHQHHFEDVSPDDFERLVYWLVKRSGEFDAVQWYGGARDKGRDVVAYRHTAGREKWYIQCKRYRSIAFPTLRDELDKLAGHASEEPGFAPDVIVFATACPVPPDAKDRAAAHARALGLPAPYYWGRLELDERLKAQPEIEEEFFGSPAPSSPPAHVDLRGAQVEGSVIVGDLNLTVPGLSSTDLNTLMARILEALRSAAPVTIAGGPGDTTVLAVDGEPQVVASKEQGAALAGRAARSVEAYLAGLVVHRDFGPWDTRYVPLAGTAPLAVTPEAWAGYIPIELRAWCPRGEGPQQRIERVPIPDIAAAVRDYAQFVLLGEPGAGKTTVLQKIALDAARARLQDASAPVPLFVRLGTHRGDETPFEFLRSRWRARLGTDFDPVLRAGSVFLLLDALNEMPRAGRAERVAAWRNFARDWEGVRMVFTCRTLDYDPLGLQRVEVSRLDDERVRDFLNRYVPDHASGLWEELARHPAGLLDLARNPFLLTVLAWNYAQAEDRRLPSNRGQLLASLVARLLERERMRAHPDWIEPAAQERALSALAWTLQGQGEGTSLPVGETLGAIPARVSVDGRPVETPPAIVLRLGCAATLLEQTLEGQVRFYHHLVQEYFAAGELLHRFAARENLQHLWKVPWQVPEMPEPEGRREWDPLPPLPPTGWEETTIVAAGLAAEPASLVEAVQAVNPILAGRCLDEGGATVPGGLRQRVRAGLLGGMQDRRVHLRARIAAGRVLGRLGDPRFVARGRDGVRYLVPPLVRVPGGTYAIGSSRRDRQAYDREKPRHRVRLAAFWIGQYPVTVAEYRCFVEAGGYREERHWETEAARAWLRGEEAEGGALQAWLELRQWLLDSGRPLEYWAKEWSWTPQTLETWRRLTTMSEEEAREALHPIYAERSRQEPAWWDDPAFTGANQPVVGVTWYEARAYCAWLAEAAGQPCRLPTETEWEAAVRGGKGRIYPWGNRFAAARANTIEGRVLATTPVGVYPQGAGPLGLWDGAGNVWEWTSSLHRSYPYRMDDGREAPAASGRRVLRGGSWVSSGRFVRCAYRVDDLPDFFDFFVGFRVVFPGSPPSAL
jgi:formylglycine-generating enzyme required for sulfatase activity